MSRIVLLVVLILTGCSTIGQDLAFTKTAESKVSNEGLFFDGEKGVNYQFSNRITPHGDCIDVVNGYIFVTWYKGGMDQRNLMLSRKKADDPNANWVTIEFPHKHIGYRGDPSIGDSHNTAAIGISTIDSTIHLIYDLHAYSKASFPDNFFNYSVSSKGAAFRPDVEFTLSLFGNKQNFLNPDDNYERITYPAIIRGGDGSLIARYRIGGSGNGDIFMAHYDGMRWSENWLYVDGTIPLPDRYSLYGEEKFLNGSFVSLFSIRYADNDNYVNNNGLYFASTDAFPPTRNDQWKDINNNSITIPIDLPDGVKIAEPSDDYGTATAPRTSFDPAFTVTANGAIHAITRVDNRNVHYYRGVGESEFLSNVGGQIPNPQVRGDIFSYGGQVFMVELVGGKPVIKSTPEGTNNWQIVYSNNNVTRVYSHFDAILEGSRLYIYLMESVEGDARPLYLQEYEVTSSTTSTDDIVRLEGVNIYPNPGSGIFTITSEDAALDYILISGQGKHLESGKIRTQSLDLSKYPKGVYLLKVSNTLRTITKQIVHQ